MTDIPVRSDATRFEIDMEQLTALLDDGVVNGSASAAIRPRPADAVVPMSFAQELLWLLDRATPGLAAYNLSLVRRLRGALDRSAFDSALTALVTRHESLRSRFADVEGAHRLIVDAPAPVRATDVDLSDRPPESREAEARQIVRERSRAPFDLAAEHMFRATIVRLAADEHVLVLESHHIVMDGWSLSIVARDLSLAYADALAGRTATLPAARVQFGDYAIWQRDRLQGAHLDRLLSFWREQLVDATDPLGLTTDHPRPTTPTFEGARATVTLPKDQLALLKRVAQARGATLYMVLLAAYGIVLHRYTGRERVLIGSGSAGRSQPETEDIVGYLANTLVQVIDCAGDPTVDALVSRVRDSALGAYDHQEVPLEKLVLELRDRGDRSSLAPLFDVVLTMQDAGGSGVSLEGLVVESFGFEAGLTKFDITLLPAETADGLRIAAQYRADLFERATMQRFLGHLAQVLGAMAADPTQRLSALPLLSDEERALLAACNATTVDEGATATVVELFERQVLRVGDRAAVQGDGAALTYRDLDAAANRLAHRLRELGAAPDVPVGLLLERGPDALVGLLGILKSGGACVPLAADAPSARIAQQLSESDTRVVVTIASLAGELPADCTSVALDRDAEELRARPVASPVGTARPEHLAYVLYTSGSTGAPKGVAVTHANVVHYARAISRVLGDVPATQTGDGFAALDALHFGLVSTLAADLGNTSIYPALLSGGTLHVLPGAVATEPARFADYVAEHPLDILKITPNHFAALAAGRTGRELASLMPRRWLVLGGEPLRADAARALLAPGTTRLLNHYGPTETTVGVCTFEATRDSLDAAARDGAQTVPIGAPLANTKAFVVDAYGAEQPVGVAGELLLGGAGVARGYLHRDLLTAERFGTFAGERVYRTGDRVRRRPNGSIEFLGRTDDQVKVRGYRVELGEIEAVLARHPGVARAAVIARAEGGTEPTLAAYAVLAASGYAASHGDRPSPETLAQWLTALLPAYMIPSSMVVVDALPLTPNGKIDRAALAVIAAAPHERAHAEADGETERQLAVIWSEVLKRDRVGRTENFLDLGGHSLLAIRMLGKISKEFGVRLPLRALFDSPTIEQLGKVIETQRATDAPLPTIAARSRDAYRVGGTPTDVGGRTEGDSR